ncbi:hypothetical protein LDJ79_05145 [Vibrio tritonius]|uniref:Uncharacterized protein n=1 Tax=Vibrio tritonius TaxID=1435069 RepID=A0ABS7YML6_9VIBR|nr:hypothetical protein [Vibrio tritonius]MCA2015489.1 hypothetical protein [Vibrio tritonius]
MNPVGAGSANLYSTQTVKSHTSTRPGNSTTATANTPLIERKEGSDKVSLSSEGQALLKTLKQIDKTGTLENVNKEKTIGDKVESFTYGALGLEKPEQKAEKEEEKDSSYSAGRYLSAAATIGGLILAIV